MKETNRKERKERKEPEGKRDSKSFLISPVVFSLIGMLPARIMIVTNKKLQS
jgi:hypothetical protein